MQEVAPSAVRIAEAIEMIDVSHRARSRSTMLKCDLALFSLNRGLPLVLLRLVVVAAIVVTAATVATVLSAAILSAAVLRRAVLS